MGAMETSRKSLVSHSVVMLLVGALVGFAAGYFAGGGGRPTTAVASSAAGGGGGDRAAQLQQALDRDPENPQILTELGNLYYDRQEWDRAIAMYEKARRKAPKDPNLLSDLGAAHRNRGEFDLAIAFFQKAREADPNHWQSLLNWTLVEAFDLNDRKAAQPLLDEVKKRYPEIPGLDRIQAQVSSLPAGG
jgi:tetratricopeptide (TPR) repeat protein